MHRLLLFFIVAILAERSYAASLIEVFKWKQINFYNRGSNFNPSKQVISDSSITFPGRAERSVLVDSTRTSLDGIMKTISGDNSSEPNYIPYNNVPMGVSHNRGRLFITVPRRRQGIPSTLNYIDLRKPGMWPSPYLRAYPNFTINQFNLGQSNIVSVYRTTVDSCQRLWFIDTGIVEYPNNRQQIKRPAIWIIDLTTDGLIRRFEIPEDVVATGQGLASITIDVEWPDCSNAFAYIPDLVHSTLSVYSFSLNRIWTFNHNYFRFDPLAGELFIGGHSFRWNDGIFSTTVGELSSDGKRNVYFHAMASTNEFVVSNEVLKHESNAARSDHGQDFRLLGNRGRDRQSTIHKYDKGTGVIFYSEIQRNGVGCWNTKHDFAEQSHGTVAENADTMIYPSDLTIDENGSIWLMTNSMPIFIYGQLDLEAYNFRVWRQNAFEAKKDTVCE